MATTHRYWRIYITAANGSGIAGLSEIELRATSAGADQTPGVGTALSGGDFSAGFAKANAFDNTTSEWASLTLPGWIGWDAGVSPIDVFEFTITSRTTDAVNGPLQAPKTFGLEWSDDAVTWYPRWAPSNQTGWTLSETRTFTDPLPSGRLGATKAVTYGVLGPPLLLASTKSVMYVITGPDDGTRQRIKVRYVRSHR